MHYVEYSHRYADIILNSAYAIRKEFEEVIRKISLNDLETRFNSMNKERRSESKKESQGKQAALNSLFKEYFIATGWEPEKAVFADPEHDLVMDFWKTDFGIDVAFNHRSFLGGDLLRLQAAAEVKSIIKVGVYICATKEFAKYLSPKDGNSIVSFERVRWYLENFYPVITTPIYVVGLTF
ncbi:BglII/BstYI family type II restriction endonuclease [Leptospira kmetyi]|uniref:BglII/BstYI family type II restriction endonuclease n=1 Tax=Leptospira kmetyi TaxID=408139 RepID=UPI003EBC2F21